jgi:hypothetical protein
LGRLIVALFLAEIQSTTFKDGKAVTVPVSINLDNITSISTATLDLLTPPVQATRIILAGGELHIVLIAREKFIKDLQQAHAAPATEK